MPEPYKNCNRPERPLRLPGEHGGRDSSRKAVRGDPRQTHPASSLENRRCWTVTLAKFKVRVVSVPALGYRLFVLEEGFVDENRLAALELLQQVLGLLIQDKLL